MIYLDVYDELRAEGKAEGLRAALLEVLAHRGLALDDSLRARVSTCTSGARLERWFQRALTAATVEAIFAEP